MESLSIGVSSSLPFPNPPKHTSHSIFILSNSLPKRIPISNFIPISSNLHQPVFLPTLKNPHTPKTHTPNHQSHQNSSTHFSNLFKTHLLILKNTSSSQFFLKPHLSFLCLGLSFPLSCFASETSVFTEEAVPSRINLEAILVSIDDFFNRNPFFVAGVTFIWLVVIPLTQEYLHKFKFVSAIDAFRKLRDDPNCQLLDIREKKNLKYLGSPNLKILNKNVVQVDFFEGGEDSFVKKVLESFPEPENTTICILDSFDGNSIKVAELLFNKGFKEAYAIRGGVKGKKGWQEIQESLLPPSVHMNPTKKVKKSQQPEINEEVNQRDDGINQASSLTSLPTDRSKQIENGYVSKSAESIPEMKHGPRSSSPYPHYPDLKPPSSPTPAKPRS